MCVDRPRHALPDQVAAIAHRARLGCSFLPAESRSALYQTLAHGARGKATATLRIDVRIIEQANGYWIDSRGVSKLIQSALKRKMTERLMRRSKRGRGVAIHMRDFVIGRDSAACSPKRPRTERRVFDVVVEHRRRRNTVVTNAVQLAASLRTELDYLQARRLMADHGIHLCARKLNVNRPVQHLRYECCDQSMRPDIRLAAKTTTEKMTNDVDLLLRNAENHGDQVPGTKNVLRGFVQRERPI